MKRTDKAELAKQTLEIIERKSYRSPHGRTIDLSRSIDDCLDSTRLYSPEELDQLRDRVLAMPSAGFDTVFEVVNETTLEGIARTLSSGFGPVAALNFASAKNPGGGFLGGSQAQEESLARSSALYASLLRGRAFYDRHRAMSSLLYSDSMIVSPHCPIFRDDEGTLREEPHVATFITSPAPNTGAIDTNRRHEMQEIPEVFRRRSEYVLALAASQGYRHLVLGAWGCGVFRNDPEVVARAFFGHLRMGNWSGRFERVVFSVFDTSPKGNVISTFQKYAFRTGQ